MPASPRNIDEYLAPLSASQRTTLEKLRRAILSAAPEAEECIMYQIPSFRLDGKALVSFGAWKDHCSFFPGAFPIRQHAAELQGYSTSKGTVRFAVDRPLPAALVRRLMKTRMAEHSAARAATSKAGRRRVAAKKARASKRGASR